MRFLENKNECEILIIVKQSWKEKVTALTIILKQLNYEILSAIL